MGRECIWEQRTLYNHSFKTLLKFFLYFWWFSSNFSISSFWISCIDIKLICLVWFKLWFVMLPVCIHFEVLVFPVKMMNRWDYFRNCELYLTRFWHFGAFSLPVSLSPVENLHPKSLTANIHEFTYQNPAFDSEHENGSHDISADYSKIFTWICWVLSYEFAKLSRFKIFKVEFSLEPNSDLSSKSKRMRWVFSILWTL